MEASKVTVGGKAYDLNVLNKTKKTNLRRKLIVEYIQSKPAGEYIRMRELQQVAQLGTTPNANAFVKRMIRDGVIQRHNGEKPRSFYYSILGSVRVKKSVEVVKTQYSIEESPNPNISSFVADMQKLGVKFTITISNEASNEG